MGNVHLRKSGQWAVCTASVRACPLPYHVADLTLAEAKALPGSFVEQLQLAAEPPEVSPVGNLSWLDAKRLLHRDYDLPALITAKGVKQWAQHGDLHRVTGPAVIYPNGRLEWWWRGVKHRSEDLPAVITPDGKKEWWLEGLPRREDDKPAVLYPDGTQEWWNGKARHRDDDLPAVIYANGTQEWWQHGERHREDDKPALLHADGSFAWYHKGLLHRDVGPATIAFLKDGKVHYEHWVQGKLHATYDDKAGKPIF